MTGFQLSPQSMSPLQQANQLRQSRHSPSQPIACWEGESDFDIFLLSNKFTSTDKTKQKVEKNSFVRSPF